MSIIQQHTSATLGDSWRTINIDAYNEDSSVNFDISTLHPPQPEISEAEVRQLAGQVRQLLQGGDAEGALRGCLETPVYVGTEGAKVCFSFSFSLTMAHEIEGTWQTFCIGIQKHLANHEKAKRTRGNLCVLLMPMWLGRTSPNHHRSPAIDQGQRNESALEEALRIRGWKRVSRRSDEVHVRRIPAFAQTPRPNGNIYIKHLIV